MEREGSSIQVLEPNFNSIPLEHREVAQTGFSRGTFTFNQAQDPDFITVQVQLLDTARHEAGHKTIAESVGFPVIETSIIQNGPVLGYTRISPPTLSTDSHTTINVMAMMYGGWAAEAFFGHTDHSGCGSDMAKAQMLASRTASLSSGLNAEGLHAAARTRARATISRNGKKIEETAWRLLKEKVI